MDDYTISNGTVWYSMVQYGTIWYSMVQMVQYRVILKSLKQY